MTTAPVRAGIIGVGRWAGVVARAAKGSPRLQIVRALGKSPERAGAFSRENGIPLANSIEGMLAEPGLDAVLLLVPNELHLPFTKAAAEAGKHVYIEKPIANELQQALAILALERSCGIRIAVGHCARLLAGTRLIHQMANQGVLGHVTQIEANFSNDRALRLNPGDWRWYRASAPGGSLSQVAIHQFDTLRYLGGDIATVSASAARHSPVGAEVEDQWIITVRFADGKLGSIVSSWTSPGSYHVRVTGDAALTEFYEIDQSRWSTPEILQQGATLYVQPRGKGPDGRQITPVPPGNMVREELELFADSILSDGPCELSAKNGYMALAAVYAALESANNHGVAVPLATTVERGGSASASQGRDG